MSTYWYFECLDHTPALQSVDEFTQHTDDGAYRLGMTLAASRPLDRARWDGDQGGADGYFERNARTFLEQHPACRLEAVSEYGDRVRIERPVPTADGTDYNAWHHGLPADVAAELSGEHPASPHMNQTALHDLAGAVKDIAHRRAGVMSTYEVANLETAHEQLNRAADEIDRLQAKVVDQRRVNVANIAALNLTLEQERAQSTADRLTLESVRAAHAEYRRTLDRFELVRALNTLLDP